MRIVSGIFDTSAAANQAVDALRATGIAHDDISLIGPHGKEASGAAEGAGTGAIVGGGAGLLAGLGVFAIPGIGPVVGAGWLISTLVGAAAGGLAGGLIGSLTDAGVDERDAHVYAESIKRGGTLVTARVDETNADAAQAILGESGSVDPSLRRGEYEAEGWSGFRDHDPLTIDPTRARVNSPGVVGNDDLTVDPTRPRVDPVVTTFPR